MATDDLNLTKHSAPAGYWGWEPPGKPVTVQIKLDAVDGMLTSIIDGFGSIPKRGAEVGGILFGTISKGPSSSLVYRIEDFADVPCMHKFGPSYVLTDEDRVKLQTTLDQASLNGRGLKVVGFYRSHTREGLFLAPEDQELIKRYFSAPDQIVLLVRPAAMKVCMAGFFYRENGNFQPTTYLEFPFRRSELETGEAPTRRPLTERVRGEQGRRPPQPPSTSTQPPPLQMAPQQQQQQPPQLRSSGSGGRQELDLPAAPTTTSALQQPGAGIDMPYGMRMNDEDIPMPSQVYAVTTPANPRRKGWYWYPLSFIFLLLGVLLGFQAALTFNPGARSAFAGDNYTLGLSISRAGDDVTVRWDRQNPAVRAAQRGVLEIMDGKYSKHVDLDASQLQSGSVIYRFSSNQLKFRLEVFPQERVGVSETVEWRDNR